MKSKKFALGYESGLVFPVNVSDEKFKDFMDLLLITDDNKSHYVYISRILIDLCVISQNIRIKGTFACIVSCAIIVKKFW